MSYKNLMSLNKRIELSNIAKVVCRELRQSATEAENIMWDRIRNRKLNDKKFLRQHPIFYDLSGKESFFVADFYCHEEKLIIELDGQYHKYRLNEDKNRTNILKLLGFRVIRFSNEEVIKDMDATLNKIKNNF